MKTIQVLLFLLICGYSVGQDIIITKSGEKIAAEDGTIRVDARNKRILYKLPNVEKRQKIKYKELVAATYKDHRFETFNVGGKKRGFFILANDDGNRLGALSTGRTVSKGGFEVPYMRYELAIIDPSGKVIKHLTFTDVNNPNNIAMRKTAGEAVRNHFQKCPNLLERFRTFENTDSKVEFADITEMINKPYFISCK